MEYPENDRRLVMLNFLRAEQEKLRESDKELWLEFYPRPPLLLISETRLDVPKSLGSNAVETIERLRELDIDGYVRLQTGKHGFDAGGLVGVAFTEKGLTAVRKLPDPQEDVLERLDAIADAIRSLQGVSNEEKKTAINAVEELKHFARGLPPGIVVELGTRFLGA